jgi:hypothetical protein
MQQPGHIALSVSISEQQAAIFIALVPTKIE